MMNDLFNDLYRQQTQLLLQVLPIINQENCFSLKGGTAINLFVQEMPRLSVDIDLAFQPISPRSIAIPEINQALKRIAKHIKLKMPTLKVIIEKSEDEAAISKIIIQAKNATVKIETTDVFRGFVFPSQSLPLCYTAQTVFETFLEVNVVSLGDLYAGKLCAALNRQHPRDLFDVKVMLETIGLTEETRHAFIVYLASDRRPIHELLMPRLKNDQETVYHREFKGMTRVPTTFDSLSASIKALTVKIQQALTDSEKAFLLSVAVGKPSFKSLDIAHLNELPALQWKIQNIQKMDKKKRSEHVKLLENYFGLKTDGYKI